MHAGKSKILAHKDIIQYCILLRIPKFRKNKPNKMILLPKHVLQLIRRLVVMDPLADVAFRETMDVSLAQIVSANLAADRERERVSRDQRVAVRFHQVEGVAAAAASCHSKSV